MSKTLDNGSALLLTPEDLYADNPHAQPSASYARVSRTGRRLSSTTR